MRQTSTRQLVRVPAHINDPAFVAAVLDAFRAVHGGRTDAPQGGEVAMRFERSALMEKFRGMVARGEPIVGGGAGTGLSAKCEEAGGIDLIVIYNSGRYRMAGRGSLAGLMAYGDANADRDGDGGRGAARGEAHAGARRRERHRSVPPDGCVPRRGEARSASPGVQNFPTVGIIDGTFRANLEETGMSYGLEVDMIAKAHAKDMLTTPYVFNEDEAAAMAKAGADIIVCHMGLTTGGAIGAETALKLADCPALVDAWSEAALKVRRDVIVLVHGGPVAEPADAEFVLKNTKNCHGFYGASSMERLPVEVALTEQTRKFKADRPALSRQDGAPSPHGEEDMSGVLIGQLILWLIIAIIVIAIVVYLVNWLYHRSSKEVSFVRTGLFGERVVINGGAFVLPFIHDYTPVNMNVLQMEIVREKADALITKDRMRVDIEAEFYVRVTPDQGSGLDRRRDAWPPHHGAGAPARAALRQIRLGAALDRLRNDHGGNARAARRLRHAREAGRRRRAGAERP